MSLLLLIVPLLTACGTGGRASGGGGGGGGGSGGGHGDGADDGQDGGGDQGGPGAGEGEAVGRGEGEGEGEGPGAGEGEGEGEGPDDDPPPPDGLRTKEEVCERWRTERVQVFPEWTEGGAGQCALGDVPADAIDNGVRRTNLYRWLVGLPPVTLAEDRFQMQQECAAIMSALGGLTHGPRPDAPCYTAEGASAAGSSNLSYGSGLAGSVDAYVGDQGVASLGHRRWILNPAMTQTAFGYKPPAGCMHVFSFRANNPVDYIAWPPPGPVPSTAARGQWSISFFDLRPEREVRIEVDVDGAGLREVRSQRLSGGVAGDPTYGFQVPPGVETRVVVHGADLEYTVRFVDCGA